MRAIELGPACREGGRASRRARGGKASRTPTGSSSPSQGLAAFFIQRPCLAFITKVDFFTLTSPPGVNPLLHRVDGSAVSHTSRKSLDSLTKARRVKTLPTHVINRAAANSISMPDPARRRRRPSLRFCKVRPFPRLLLLESQSPPRGRPHPKAQSQTKQDWTLDKVRCRPGFQTQLVVAIRG